KEEIIKGKYEPGSRIVIHSLARSYGFSEIPVREALKTLEAEGFVSNTPHVGFIVTKPNFEAQSQVFEVRQLLEGQAVWMAARAMAPEALATLKNLVEEMKGCSSSDLIRLAQLNYQFHDLIYFSCGNPILYNLIKQVWAMAPRSRSIFSLVKGRAQSSVREHVEIYRHLAAGDAERAKQALVHHKQKSYDMLARLAR
ncbi:MAG: GntR family transcriptional regulator, partial [Deltaproteobacteria bacterium]